MQAGGGEEQGNEDPVGRAAEARGDFPMHPAGHPGERHAEQQRPHGAVQLHLLGAHHDQEEPAEDDPEGELRHVDEALQAVNDPRQDLRGQHPGDHREDPDVGEEAQDAG